MEIRDVPQRYSEAAAATAWSGRRVVLLAGVPFGPVTALLLEPAAFRLGFTIVLAFAAYTFLGPALSVTRDLLTGAMSSHSGRRPRGSHPSFPIESQRHQP